MAIRSHRFPSITPFSLFRVFHYVCLRSSIQEEYTFSHKLRTVARARARVSRTQPNSSSPAALRQSSNLRTRPPALGLRNGLGGRIPAPALPVVGADASRPRAGRRVGLRPWAGRRSFCRVAAGASGSRARRRRVRARRGAWGCSGPAIQSSEVSCRSRWRACRRLAGARRHRREFRQRLL